MVATIDTACSNELGVHPENGHDKLCCGSGLVGGMESRNDSSIRNAC